MNIAIPGAGAMGSAIGALLAKAGNDVTLIDVRKEAVEAINRDGLKIQNKAGEITTHKVRAVTSPTQVPGPVELLLVSVKCCHTVDAVKSALPVLGPDSTVLSLPGFRFQFSILSSVLLLLCAVAASAASVSFHRSATRVDRFDFLEITVKVSDPPHGNPFTEAEVVGEFTPESGAPIQVDGFCDSADGSILRIRFMPRHLGWHNFNITYRRGTLTEHHAGSFIARAGERKGPVRVDPEHPFHFIREGAGEHFFYNGTTAYWLLGWREDAVIRQSLDRLARLKVNRIRVALNGRTKDGLRWKEPMIVSNDDFQYRLEPWPAARPLDIENPGYDVSRFNLEHFRKAERMLRHARDLDVIVSLIFHLDGHDKGVDPFGHDGMGGADEQRYYRYCVARFAAFENVMWDVTNEYRLFRNDGWAEQMGAFLRERDPYDHTTSIHGHGDFRFRKSHWADYAMFQSWDEHGAYDFMLKNRREQSDAGRLMPQVNEEYGYEDHYPYPWGEKRVWPARIADSRRKLAWEMAMAGGYQSTGERANIAGQGGWITGRGNDEMTMLRGYATMRGFFERFPWWKLEPRPDLVSGESKALPVAEGGKPMAPAFCLAEPGRRYVVYLRQGGTATVQLEAGRYRVERFNPRGGASAKLADAAGGAGWTSPLMPDTEDWVLLLERHPDRK